MAEIEQALDRDRFYDPEEAKAFGLLDHVVATRPVTEGGSDDKAGDDEKPS